MHADNTEDDSLAGCRFLGLGCRLLGLHLAGCLLGHLLFDNGLHCLHLHRHVEGSLKGQYGRSKEQTLEPITIVIMFNNILILEFL